MNASYAHAHTQAIQTPARKTSREQSSFLPGTDPGSHERQNRHKPTATLPLQVRSPINTFPSPLQTALSLYVYISEARDGGHLIFRRRHQPAAEAAESSPTTTTGLRHLSAAGVVEPRAATPCRAERRQLRIKTLRPPNSPSSSAAARTNRKGAVHLQKSQDPIPVQQSPVSKHGGPQTTGVHPQRCGKTQKEVSIYTSLKIPVLFRDETNRSRRLEAHAGHALTCELFFFSKSVQWLVP